AKRFQDTSGRTASGAILGTPSYMAPEQAEGRSRLVGPAADVYALGAILYELLTDRPPFRAATPMDTLLEGVAQEPLPPRRLEPSLPRDLETICLKCLRKRPEERYADALELAEDLRRFRRGQPIRARPVGRAERLVKWVRRRPAQAVAYGLLVLLLLFSTGGTAMVLLWTRTDLARKDAEEARTRAERAQKEAEYARDQALETARNAVKNADDVRIKERLDAERERLQEGFREQMTLAPYARTVALAHHAWRENEVGRTESLLQDCPLRLRHWEWYYVHHLCHAGVSTFSQGGGGTGRVQCIAFNDDGSRLTAAFLDNTVKVWDTATGRELVSLKRQTGVYAAFSTDGRRLASASGDSAKVFDVATGQETLSLLVAPDRVQCVAFSPDGKHIATGGWGLDLPRGTPSVKVGGAVTGRETAALVGQTGPAQRVAISPDGRRLATASFDPTVKLWDTATGQEVGSFKGQTGPVQRMAFSPDGRRLAAACHDGMVKVWDADTGQELLSAKG